MNNYKQVEKLIIENQVDELEQIIVSNPNVLTQKTNSGINLLRLACYFQKKEIASFIAKQMKELDIFDAISIGKFTDITYQVSKDPLLIDTYSEDGYSCLNLACHFGHKDIVRFLLMKGADANVPSKNGANVYPLHDAVACDYINIANTLIEAGAKVNVVQKSGLTPLHSAAQNGNIEMIILLLENGAITNIKMNDGKLPSHLAKERGHLEIAEILS